MKSFNIFCISAFALFLFVIACKKSGTQDNLEPEEKKFLTIVAIDMEQIADKEAVTLTVPVKSNVAYKVKSNSNWITVPKEDNEANKEFSLILSENLDSEVRQGSVTVSSEGVESVTVSVKQGGVAPFALMSPEVVDLDSELTFQIKIKTNIEYDLTIPTWLTLKASPNRALTRTDEWTYEATSTLVARNGEISLTGKGSDSNITGKITVNQGIDLSLAPKFAVISDTHMRTAGNDNATTDSKGKIEKTLEYLVSKNPEAIFIVGDVTDNGLHEEHVRLKASLDAKVPAHIPVYMTTGNHDIYGTNREQNFIEVHGYHPNRYFEFKGHPCIMVAMDISSGKYYNDRAKNYLTEKLAQAAADYPGKPIFVFYHVAAQGTVYGSAATGALGGGWGSDVLNNIIEQYPQAIAFSGHSHFPLGDERSIHQDKFTSINLGSVTYAEFENNGFYGGIHGPRRWEVTEGIIVEPVDNATLKAQGKYYKDFKVTRYDTYRLEEIKEPWLIKAPHDGTAFTYKSRTGSVHNFASGAQVTVSNVTADAAVVTWPQAPFANTFDKVHHYELRVLSETGQVMQTHKIYSQFYLNSEMPPALNHQVTGLAFGTTYRIEIRAIDSWYTNRSQPIVSQNFTTQSYTPDPSVTAPTADLFDVAFTNNSAVNYVTTYSMVPVQGTNTVTYAYNTTLQQYLATYTDNNQSMHKLDYAGKTAFIDKFRAKFSIEVFFKNTSTANKTPVSAQQSGGLGIERASGANGATQLWAHLGGSYKQVGSTVTNQTDYYHMVFTYDGTKMVAYTDGVKVGELAQTGLVSLPTDPLAHWFGIGGDANPSGNAEFSMPGDIVFTRLYSEALSLDQVFRLNEEIGKRKNMTQVGTLNTYVTTTIPNKISQGGPNTTQLQAKLVEGWKLMNSLKTTDGQISTFKNEVDAL